MSDKGKKRADDEAKSRRELLAATAKLSAFIGAMGLTGAGLAGTASADTKVPGMHKTGDVTLKRGVVRSMSPAQRQRALKGLLNDAMRTGDSRAALKRHGNLKLSPRQEQALTRMTRRDWAALRSAQAKLAPLKDLAAGDTGYVFW